MSLFAQSGQLGSGKKKRQRGRMKVQISQNGDSIPLKTSTTLIKSPTAQSPLKVQRDNMEATTCQTLIDFSRNSLPREW